MARSQAQPPRLDMPRIALAPARQRSPWPPHPRSSASEAPSCSLAASPGPISHPAPPSPAPPSPHSRSAADRRPSPDLPPSPVDRLLPPSVSKSLPAVGPAPSSGISPAAPL